MNDYLVDKKDVKYWKLALSLVSVAVLIFIDQITKYLIVKKIPLYGQHVIIKDFFSLYYVQNTGSAFSMFADRSWGIYFLSGISTFMSIVIVYALYKSLRHKSFFLKLALILYLAGAIGNLIDRFRFHYVVDFLRFDFGSFTYPIFNFADICAVVATIILIGLVIFRNKVVDQFLSLFELFKGNIKNDTQA